jgi:hypothetical protein
LRIFSHFVVERYAIIDEKLVKDMKKILETNQTKLIEEKSPLQEIQQVVNEVNSLFR